MGDKLMILPPHLEHAPAEELLRWAVETFRERFAVLTSFQHEGMVVLDMAVRIDPKVRVITLDTGRLPEETYEMMETVRRRWGVAVEIAAPEAGEVERMTTRFGPNLFYDGVPYRNLCCHIRKVRPLERKLATVDAYAVGLRREQSEARKETPRAAETNGKLKLAPLADWSAAEVRRYEEAHEVPAHPLYGRGYASIGCAPCTRAIKEGEDERAGRWWWESGGARECGIHFRPDGGVERTLDVLVREIGDWRASNGVSIQVT